MAFENRYSAADRLLHRLAFATRRAQIGLADLEDVMFRDQLARHELDRPLFITALPRAGTTLLLEMCVASGAFASQTYRHMPFVLIPLLWNRLSHGFRRPDAPRERAHGDGMLVSVDSPEAFEETAWIAFWPERYRGDRIVPWREEDDGTFRGFLHNYFKKIVALSATAGDGMADRPHAPPRYASKNNLNMARIPWLARHFRDALFVIPFRDPLQQSASLLRQHLNFLEIHRRDPFAVRYMRGIGHFDFGDSLRPVDFDGWLDRSRHRGPGELGFWLAYWLAAYRSLLAEATERVCFVNYDALCVDPLSGLERLAQFTQVEDKNALLTQASRVHGPSPQDTDCASPDGVTVEEAKALHAHLAALSMCD
jgi:Sulfotransferase family